MEFLRKKMEIINQAIEVVSIDKFSSSTQLIAQALASAFHPAHEVNMEDLSKRLDDGNNDLVYRLINIASQNDCNAKQHVEALRWLKRQKYIIFTIG
jgi:hypothetical protein